MKPPYQLVHVGRDDFSRELYKDEITGYYFCDTSLNEPYSEKADICIKGKNKHGEPSHSIENYVFVKGKA